MPATAKRTAIVHDSFTIERTYTSSVEKVYGAFADPTIKRRWYAEGPGFIVDSYSLDFRVGGKETGAFRVDNPDFTSEEIRNDTYYLDIVDRERLVYAYSMSNVGVPFSASLATIVFERGDDGGTRLTFHEQVTFFEGADGVTMREAGTRQLLEALAAELGEESFAVDWDASASQ
jgi:uncharacterized protein YndB with AHSA1/START domain